MSTIGRILIAAPLAALALAGGAAAAEAPVVSAQQTATGHAPVTIPGTGVKRGERLPAGARLVYREVTLERGQQVRVPLRAPAGLELRGLAQRGSRIGFAVAEPREYVGRRRVVVRAFPRPGADGEQTGRIYALAR